MLDPDKARHDLDALEKKVQELGAGGMDGSADAQISALRDQIRELQVDLAGFTSAWKRVQLARHPQRPHTLDYVKHLFQDFTEIHGDRAFGEDAALVTGFARFHGDWVMMIGHQKGRDTAQKLHRNFGMPKPEGYRKALRAMRLAAKFGRPILSFVDTPGAYPGIGSEERGQAEAIAKNLMEMARLPVPIIVTIIGEGGSGGALGIAVGDRILMLENAVYSVISPEGCASITWRDGQKAELAAEALKITAPDLIQLGIVDQMVSEPAGGAHSSHEQAAQLLDATLKSALMETKRLPIPELLEARYQKFRRMGQFFRESPA
jgi:acetyl-CoA carboxylase carboxyl transferase subunit alpha